MNAKIKLTFFFSAVLALFVLSDQAQNRAAVEPAPKPALLPLRLEQPLSLMAESPGVEWHGSVYHLLRLGEIQFDFDKPSSHLQASLRGGSVTFDNVTYEVSAAVFDAGGQLLGTARAQCEIQREWLGRTLTQPRNLSLDFGTSLDYPNAASFMISINKCHVLTPDDWQKQK